MKKNRQIYDSYEMYNLSGEKLSFCSHRKARSYVVKKEIATWLDDKFNEIPNEDIILINEDNMVNISNINHIDLSILESHPLPIYYSLSKKQVIKKFRLNFQANIQKAKDNNQKKQFDDQYYQQKLENVCVCCGTTEYLTRHHVIPYMYRKYLHGKFKDNNHHDVLPMCYECHRKYELEADDFKLQLAYQYHVPINLENIKTEVEVKNEQILKARYIIKQFFNNDLYPESSKQNIIPIERLEQLGQLAIQKPIILNPSSDDELEKYMLPRKTMGEIVLRQASSISHIVNDIRTKIKAESINISLRKKKSGESLEKYMNYLYQHTNYDHPIIQQTIQDIENEIYKFIFAWRNHFLEHAKPEYMPKYWDVFKKYD